MPMKHSTYSAIIVGSGIAGLYAAIKLAQSSKVPDGILLLTKSALSECNSRYAQGGIVGVLKENTPDSISLHVADTIKAGCGLCDFNVVKFISENSQHAIEDLMACGVNFDRNEENKLNFTLEGAHSVRRILHVGGDATGYGIEKALVDKLKNDKTIAPNVTIYEQTLAVELLLDSHDNCRGVISFNSATKEYEALYAPVTVLATGGTGQIYKYTTNPSVTTGDGLALAIKAHAKIKDMEFIQFHPTALALENSDSRFLISESVRGEGAKLVNQNGEYFMQDFAQKDLAPRDVVAREIYSQLSQGNKVFLDASFIGIDKFKKRFPNIYKTCLENNIDITKDFIPVAPAAHYCMGGIKTEINGKTSINNLFAIGEAACTSLHGANRLASNSLLECVVSAYEFVNTVTKQDLHSSKIIDETVLNTIKKYAESDNLNIEDYDVTELKAKIKNVMWNNVGIIRTETSLLTALSELNKINDVFDNKYRCSSLDEYELRNMLLVAKCITNAALSRKESVGAHFRADSVSNTVSFEHAGHTQKSEDRPDDSKIIA